MFTPVLRGSPIIDSSLEVFYDFGDPASYLPNFGTTVRDLSANGTNGTLVGGPVYRTDFGGCVQYDGIDDNLTFTGALAAAFTTIVIVCPTLSTAPSTVWANDDGGFPGYRPATNGFIDAVQSADGLIGVLGFGGSFATVNSNGWFGIGNYVPVASFANCSGFTTNGTNRHRRYQNGFLKATNTTTYTRGASASGTINVGRDPVLTRFPICRLVAYMQYNRELSENEVAQNHQYFLNRFAGKVAKTAV
jgi:hypothetical protein